jgi:hypothetical protein
MIQAADGSTKFGKTVKDNEVLIVRRKAQNEQVVVTRRVDVVLRCLSDINDGFKIGEVLFSDFLIWMVVEIVAPRVCFVV